MKTYSFKVVLQRDEDFDGNPSGWHAYCPALERQGASTWGATEREALRNLNEVVHMVVESMLEHGEPLPEEPAHEVSLSRSNPSPVAVRLMRAPERDPLPKVEGGFPTR